MGRLGEGVPERRPLQFRFNEPSCRLKLIKTRLEFSRVSDLHRLKPPRIHLSLFPVNNWAPVGFLGRAGYLTSSLHSELDQGRPGEKETYGQASSCTPAIPTSGGWELAQELPTPHVVKVVKTHLEPTGPTSEGVWCHHFLHSCSQQSFTELMRIVMGGSCQASLQNYLQPLRSSEGSPPLPLLLAPVNKRNEEMPKLGFK